MLLTCVFNNGCQHYAVISQDRAVVALKAKQGYAPQVDGWFVPNATWQDMNNALADKVAPVPVSK